MFSRHNQPFFDQNTQCLSLHIFTCQTSPVLVFQNAHWTKLVLDVSLPVTHVGLR